MHRDTGATRECQNKPRIVVELRDTLSRSINTLKPSDAITSKRQTCGIDDLNNCPAAMAQVATALQKRNKLLERLTVDVEETLTSLNQTHETMLIAEEDHESALMIHHNLEENYNHTGSTIEHLEERIAQKRIPLQACFRVPFSVWEAILTYVVSADGETEEDAEESIKGWKHGSRADMLSTVCHSWRGMVRSLPSLWKYIFISTNDIEGSKSRVMIHLGNCKMVEVVMAIFLPEHDVDLKDLLSVFPPNVRFGMAYLKCTSMSRSNTILDAFLDLLPAPKVLVVVGWYGMKPVSVPGHFFEKLRTLEADDVIIIMGPQNKQLDRCVLYDAEVHCNINNPPWTSSLRSIRVDLYWPDMKHQTSSAFTKLERLEVSSRAILGLNESNYSFPTLTSVAIMDAHNCDWSSIRWDQLKTTLALHNLHTFVIESFEYENIDQSVDLINDAPKITTVELRGESVQNILGGAFIFRYIQTLKISNYNGDGNVIVSYVQGQVWTEELHIRREKGQAKKAPLREVVFTDCPRVGLENRLKILEMLA